MDIFISAANQAAWAGKSLLDATVPQKGDPIVLKPTEGDVSVAGISGLVPNRLVTILNRGPNAVTLAANDPAAPVHARFSVEKVIPSGKKTSLFTTGSALIPITGGGGGITIPPIVESIVPTTGALTFPFTVTDATLLFVQLGVRGSFVGTSVTFNGVPLVFVTKSIMTLPSSELWVLVNPPKVTADIVITLSGVPLSFTGHAVGIKNSVSYTAANGYSGAIAPDWVFTPYSLNIPSVADGLVVDLIASWLAGVPAQGAGQALLTQFSSAAHGNHLGMSSSKPGAGGTTNMTWTNPGSGNMAAVGFCAKPITISPEREASKFLTAAGITDPVIVTAIHVLVARLKAAGLWAKCDAIYPIVGGTELAHKFNLKNPLDTDAAFRLTFASTWVHDASGMHCTTASGGYADSKYSAFTHGVSLDEHLSFYSGTAGISGGYEWYTDASGALKRHFFSIAWSDVGGASFFNCNSNSGGGNNTISVGVGAALGMFIETRGGTFDHRAYKNSTLLGAEASASPDNSGMTGPFALLVNNTRTCSFASIGKSFTGAEALEFYLAVQAFQTMLGRAF
jgi:hypothetical protein